MMCSETWKGFASHYMYDYVCGMVHDKFSRIVFKHLG